MNPTYVMAVAVTELVLFLIIICILEYMRRRRIRRDADKYDKLEDPAEPGNRYAGTDEDYVTGPDGTIYRAVDGPPSSCDLHGSGLCTWVRCMPGERSDGARKIFRKEVPG